MGKAKKTRNKLTGIFGPVGIAENIFIFLGRLGIGVDTGCNLIYSNNTCGIIIQSGCVIGKRGIGSGQS
jgi:hypothetical protein